MVHVSEWGSLQNQKLRRIQGSNTEVLFAIPHYKLHQLVSRQQRADFLESINIAARYSLFSTCWDKQQQQW